MMLILKTAQLLRARSPCFTLPSHLFLPQVMNVAFVGCAENAYDPAHFGEAKHHVRIVLSVKSGTDGKTDTDTEDGGVHGG